MRGQRMMAGPDGVRARITGMTDVRARTALACVLACGLMGFAFSGVAMAEECTTCAPWWHVTASVRPANIAPHGEGTAVAKAVNLGDATTVGAVSLIDTLPPGVTVVEEKGAPVIGFFLFGDGEGSINRSELCNVTGDVVSCVLPEGEFPLAPFEDIEIRIKIKVGTATEEQQAEVSGGGASLARTHRPIPVGAGAPPFGVEQFEQTPESEGGTLDARAGSHPFQFSTTLALNQTSDPLAAPAMPKNLQFNLPAGLVGNATAIPQCSEADFHKTVNFQNYCPADTAVGVASVTFDEPAQTGLATYPFPLYNLVPARGEPARFGFTVVKAPVVLDTAVRTGEDYGVRVSVNNISQAANLLSTTATFWGVPSDERHHASRGSACLAGGVLNVLGEECPTSQQPSLTPFLTLPTSCETPFVTSVEGESWPIKANPNPQTQPETMELQGERTTSLKDQFGRELGITGCNQLSFEPAIEVAPDVQQASTPSGLKVDVKVPQEVSENPGGLTSSSVKDIQVTFPEGVTVNPAAADGLEACSEGQIGFIRSEEATNLFTPTLPSGFCPNASKVGTVKIKVPILAQPLEGALYLASQNANPFGSLLASYIVAEDPISGVLVKLAGEVTLNPETGQITTTFKNSPQAPLEEAEIHLFGGARAPFSTPAHCGRYTTNAVFTPWSGTSPVDSKSTFEINSGPNGSPCPGQSLPFAPTLTSGTTNINAGAFSPLSTTVSREDGNQNIQTITLHYPPGVTGLLAGVKLCPEAQANGGTCGPESLIGHGTVSVGLGNEPFSVTGTEAFLTEGYKGASFGLSIVTPAVAGPFNLGKVVVRAKVELDPHTTALTVTTDAIPHILDGIPLEIKHVNVTIDRPQFTLNPTNCNPTSITGSITSVEGATAPVSVPFQTANCTNLKFAPKFQVSTSAKTSKQSGASLKVKLAYPPNSLGSYANLAKVKVDLPKQLPSRLTTLQKACLAVVFETNRANCPAASIIGHAKAITPLVPVPLAGPVYFVSHGNEAFPSLTIVLQGYGITVDVVASTFIRHGITSSTFKATPDQPFSTFELELPEGPYSALAANNNLCNDKLAMPTAFTAQNGIEIHQTTKISVIGCGKPHHKHAKTSRKSKKGKRS